MKDLTEVLDILKRAQLLTISSLAADGSPQSALVGFAETPEAGIIFYTPDSSRKYSNLKRDPRTSVVIGGDSMVTLQYEGTASELSGAELDRSKEVYFAKLPFARGYANLPGSTFFKITPTWLRLTDLNQRPARTQEYEV
ncbi:MAG: hypothetical protein K0S68_983 [Candidatus Saccharibacteria bacterium]|jgi:pyridoxine/pyridoxamine 5'-phosphate oxidase|nr:hypothetical protein [Candidatus Saccharibacteria bacterium]